jgi:hypothetical protein
LVSINPKLKYPLGQASMETKPKLQQHTHGSKIEANKHNPLQQTSIGCYINSKRRTHLENAIKPQENQISKRIFNVQNENTIS